MKLVCLDLEGVLVPEIWIELSKKTGIDELKLTTRDIPDYDQLMKQRIAILEREKITLSDIQQVISLMDPLSGALEFVMKLRTLTQLIILSDTFEEFGKPLMAKLQWPTLFCNDLIVNPNTNMIKDYRLRQQDGKLKAVKAFQSIGMQVFAAGDSYNDLSMIKQANKGLFFRPPQKIIDENKEIGVALSHSELLTQIEAFLQS